MLKLSWRVNSSDYEMTAYDLLGRAFYLQGHQDLANFFHNRSVNGMKEAKQSPIRLLGESSYNDSKTNSEDDFDLEMFTNQMPKRQTNRNIFGNSIQNERSGIVRKVFADISQRKEADINDLKVLPAGYALKKGDDGKFKTQFLVTDNMKIQQPFLMNQDSLNRDLDNFFIQKFRNINFWKKEECDNMKFYKVKKNLVKHQSHLQKLLELIQTIIIQTYQQQ